MDSREIRGAPDERDVISRVRDRERLVSRFRRILLARDLPRLQMAAIVAATGGSGFLASFVLLQMGLDEIAVRYLAALAFAYSVFLALLYVWIVWKRRTLRNLENGDPTGMLEVDPTGVIDMGARVPTSVFSGGGGHFGGAGATASVDDPTGNTAGALSPSDSKVSLDFGFDLDEAIILVVVAAAALSLVGASFWVIVAAPTLFAELLLDGALSASLYRRLRHLERRHWLESAFRNTAAPFALAALILGAAGGVMSWYAPEARSLGEVWSHLQQNLR